jgi:hypothetical protein
LRTTSAARLNRLPVTPWAISDRLRIEQGATIMPPVLNEPDAIEAPMSVFGCTTSASACTSATLNLVS